MNKTFIKTIIILLIYSTPLFSHSSSIGKSPSVLPISNCTSGLSCGLVGYWTFDGKDMVGGVARDRSGNGNNGNLINIATSTFYTSGKIGQGFNFDGVDDYVNVNSSTSLSPSSRITISAWVKPNKLSSVSYMAVIEKSLSYNMYMRQDGIFLVFLTGVNNWVTTSGSVNLFDGSWHHIVTTYNGATQILYIDNKLISSTSASGSISTNSNAVKIGDSGGVPVRGIVDDVRIYNRDLSVNEISQLYSSGVSNKQNSAPSVVATSTCSVGLSCGLVTYWTFDGKDIVNGVVRDKSGSGGNGNLLNISTTSIYRSGMVGQGLKFSSDSDYLLASPGGITASSTISFWYNPSKPNSWVGNQTGLEIRYGGVSGTRFFRWYSTGQSPKIQVTSNNNSSNVISSEYSLETKTPYLNTFVLTTTQVDWYINGNLFTSINPSVGVFDVAIDPIKYIRLGGSSGSGQSVNGTIDEFRMYNRVLTAGEIKQLYTTVISTKQSSSQNIIQNFSCISGLSCGLVGYWTFDGKDMVAGVVRDRSGSGNSGNLINIATSTFYSPGKIGQSLNFDGNNDYVLMGDILDLNGGVPFSISTWVMFNDFTNSPAIIGKFDDNGNYAYTLEMGQLFETDGSGLGLMLLDSSNASYIGRSTSRKIVKGVWYHIVGTYDGGSTSSSVKLYYNGVQVDDTNTQGGTFTTVRNVNAPLTIGSLLSSGIPNYLIKGKIDDVRIYNRVLPQSEIIQLYNLGM